MMRTWTAAAISVLISAGATSARADDDAATRAMNVKVNVAVHRAIDTGFKLFNANDPAGCYRVYQGALVALLPLLGYRDDLRTTVEKALAESEAIPDYAGRAFALRKALDTVFRSTTPPPSLRIRLGGESVVKALVHDFVASAAMDPKVDLTRGGRYKVDAAGLANLEKTLVELVSSTAGDPLKSSGRDMTALHKGMRVTDAQFRAITADLIVVLDKYKVPQKEKDELIAIIASTKGATVEEVAFANPGDKPPPVPMPDKPTPTRDAQPLWERLGGEPAAKVIVHDFVAMAAADPRVDFTRGGKFRLDDAAVATLEKRLVQLLSATAGGPLKYDGREVKELPKGMGITGAQFDAMAADLVEILKEYKVPQKEIDELSAIIATAKKDIVEAK